jgi:hypothetical protein
MSAVRKETAEFLKEELRVEFLRKILNSDPNHLLLYRQDREDLGPVWKWDEEVICKEFDTDLTFATDQHTPDNEWLRRLKRQDDFPKVLDEIREETRRLLKDEIRVAFIKKLLETDPTDLLEFRHDLGDVWSWESTLVRGVFGGLKRPGARS